jgi:anti-sigma-K factor RskA
MTQLTDPNDLAGQYVLGTLSAERRREVEQALPNDPALRSAVDDWEARLLPLTELAEPVTPSASLWTRIDLSIAALGASRAKQASHLPWWNRLNVWRGLAAAGFAAAAVMAMILVGLRAPSVERERYLVVLAAPQNMAPGWVLNIRDDHTLQLEPLVRSAVPDQRTLQLWTKAEGWTGPVSLGLVTPGRALRVPLEKLPPVQPNQLFEITLEPPGGSPIGRPTGPILYIGRAVKTM